MRKKICLIIAIMLLFCSCNWQFVAYAKEDDIDSVIDDYFDSVVYGYLESNEQIADSRSEEIPVIDVEKGCVCSYIIVLYYQQCAIGYMNICIGDSIYSNYVKYCVDIAVGDDICFYSDDEGLFYSKDGKIINLGKTTKKRDVSAYPKTSSRVTVRACHSKSIVNDRANPIYSYLDVPCVHNDDDPYGNGLCWAASIASRVNYQNSTSLTALGVYYACKYSSVSGKPSGNPCGTDEWIKYGYKIYGINTSRVYGGKTASQIQNALSNNKPLTCYFITSMNSSNSTAHIVLLTGLYLYGSSQIYMFRDSNLYGVVSINVPSSALNNPRYFVYSASGKTYPVWWCTIQ